MEETIRALRAALCAAERVAVLTGAGISAESGVPTFRGAGGLWRNCSPQELATHEVFARDPRLVWEWYDWRRGLIAKAQPNAGHRALVELERRVAGLPKQVAAKGLGTCHPVPSADGEGSQHSLISSESRDPSSSLRRRTPQDDSGGGRSTSGTGPKSFTLITQNVDGLHDRAGSRNTVKLHGDIWVVRCVSCGAEERNKQVPLPDLPPRCKCGALLRPGVVWFGEALPPDEWNRAEQASARAQLFLAIGTSAVVYPAAGLAEIARAAGARVAVINAEPTPLDHMADGVLHAQAGDILPRLL